MDVIYSMASTSQKGQCLVSPLELLKRIPYNVDFKESDLEDVLNQLSLDNYFDYDTATTKSTGNKMYVITLRDNGISYLRDKQVSRRKLAMKVIITLIFAAFSFSIKYILQLIFHK